MANNKKMGLDEKNLVSLKEAAEASGYTADYIGQLIRAGKIPGKQVYSNVAWMTTAEAVLAYKNKKKGDDDKWQDNYSSKFRKIKMEFNALGLFFKTFPLALPILLAILVCALLLISYLMFAVFSETNSTSHPVNDKNMDNIITF
jgi:hypothetical protein